MGKKNKNRKRKQNESKSDESMSKVVPSKKRAIHSKSSETVTPYIVESPPSSRNGSHSDLKAMLYRRSSSSILYDEDDNSEISGITLTEESDFGDEDEYEDEEDDLADFIAEDEVTDGIEDESVSDEGEEIESNFEIGENKLKNAVDKMLSLNNQKSLPKKNAVEDELENLKIDGYDLDYTNFNQGCLLLKKHKKYQQVHPKFELFAFNTNHSLLAALEAFRWLITPFDTQLFFKGIFQKKVLCIKRRKADFYAGLFSTNSFVNMLRDNYLEYGININVAKYTDGVRTTLNGSGRAYTGEILKRYSEGCSIQCTNPQAFNNEIWYFCEILQELFCSFVGANTYLTPPDSSGFAPHWDDIDAFIIQTEGRKHWKVYAPMNSRETLPLKSSGNFNESDMINRKVVFNDWLEQGDLLYIPRGFIHQAHTDGQIQSHHVTVSVNRNTAFVNMIEKILPEIIGLAAEKNSEMRFSLPPNVFDMYGIVDMRYDSEGAASDKFIDLFKSMAMKIQKEMIEYYEAGVDQMAIEFMKTALPPMLTPEEKSLSVFGKDGIDMLVDKPLKITAQSEIRLIRKHAQRLICESDKSYFLAHRMANSRVYEGRGEESITIQFEFVSGYISLMDSYPEWIKVKDLQCNSKKDDIEFAQLLYTNGLLLVKQQDVVDKPVQQQSNSLVNGEVKKKKKKKNKKEKTQSSQ